MPWHRTDVRAMPDGPARRRLQRRPLALSVAIAAVALALSAALLAPTAMADQSGKGDPPASPAAKPFEVKVGTFNVLGSQHTKGPGGFAPGHVRAAWASDLIQSKGVDVIGLQEVQFDQLRVFRRDLEDYRIWPYQRLGLSQGLRLQIAYKRADYHFVEGRQIYTRFDGNLRPIPYVRLRDKKSGEEFWFMTFHNSPQAMEAERDRATVAEIRLVNRLRRTGIPVVIGGDTNEWVEFVCKMGRGADMHSAAGGRLYPTCRAAPNPVFDKVMASKKLKFAKYRQLGGRLVWRASDHKLVTARASLTK